jgi:hypothetical protein
LFFVGKNSCDFCTTSRLLSPSRKKIIFLRVILYWLLYPISIQVSRLTALLEDQELRPSAAENSSAEEEREGKGKGKDQQEATGRGVEEAHIQEEVIQGLKEQLASAVAAQVRTTVYPITALIYTEAHFSFLFWIVCYAVTGEFGGAAATAPGRLCYFKGASSSVGRARNIGGG